MSENYHVTVMIVRITGDEPYPGSSLANLAADVDYGDYVADHATLESHPLTRGDAAELLVRQGSSPEFLIMDDDDAGKHPHA